MLQLSPLLLLLLSIFSTITPVISATLSAREPGCAVGVGCDTDGFFCCGIHCCSPGEVCLGAECKTPGPPPIARFPPQISVSQWTPDPCYTDSNGNEVCIDVHPQYRITGTGFSAGTVDVGAVVFVGVVNAAGASIWSSTEHDVWLGGSTLASLTVNTPLGDCGVNPGPSTTAMVKAVDTVSGLASNVVSILVGCTWAE